MRDFVETNGIKLSYLDHAGPEDGETLIIMHGLTANAHFFDGLIAAGLNEKMRVIAVDLRGRGQSDKPESGYSIQEHAKDIIGLMDVLGLKQAIIGGHSFGGLVTMYLSAYYPDRVKKMVIIDAGLLHPDVRELIKPSLERLGKSVPSLDMYLSSVKQSTYFRDGFWDEMLEAYYTADVEELSDGSVRARSKPDAIAEAVDQVLGEDWNVHMPKAGAPAIMLHAPDGFGPEGTPPVILEEDAHKTVNALQNCTYHQMSGHHITMMFGDNAKEVVRTIQEFVG